MLTVQVPQDPKELNKQITALTWQLQNDTREKDRQVHREALSRLLEAKNKMHPQVPKSCSECPHEVDFSLRGINTHYDTCCRLLAQINGNDAEYCIRKDLRTIGRRSIDGINECPLERKEADK